MFARVRAVFLRASFVAGIALLMTACADLPKQAMNREATSKIKTIALVETPEPTAYMVIYPHPGMMFGLIGGAVAGAEFEIKGGKFTQGLQGAGFSITRRLADDMAAALTAQGYQVERVAEVRDGSEADYAKINTRADALLRVAPRNLGYRSTTGVNAYKPVLIVDAELVSANRRDRLYQDVFFYGMDAPMGQFTQFTPAAEFAFDTFDDLMARSKLAAQGLSAGADLIAERIAKDFAALR
jgi:hypothetical protein